MRTIRKKEHKTEDDTEKFGNAEDEESNGVYDDDERQEMLENDEITAAEEGFMRGWDGNIEGGKKRKRSGDHKDEASVELAKEQYQED